MVHLGKVPNDKDVADSNIVSGINDLDLGIPSQDDFTTSVYGSKFAGTDLPKHEMPDDEMPREIAYRMIKYGRFSVRRALEQLLTTTLETICLLTAHLLSSERYIPHLDYGTG